MREILFRGKPTGKYKDFLLLRSEFCKNGFVYGNLVIDNGRYYICVSALCSSKSYINNGITTMCEVIPETVGQFTGVTDKHSEKIFKNDIIKYESTRAYICVVTFYNGSFAYEFTDKYKGDYSFCDGECPFESEKWEVIGNKYDNPELLERG